MISKKMDSELKKITKEAIHILKISGVGKDSKETYERARSTLDMLDITVRMLISELEFTRK